MLSDMIVMRDQDIAKIANRLQVPLIISDDQPDSALLSIALSARALAERFHGQAAIFTMLTNECDRIIAEYGMIWLRNAQAKKLDDNTVFETLVHIPEDLEAISELLEFAKITLEDAGEDAADLCTILTTQAGAQGIVAQTFLDSMDMGNQEPWDIYEGENINMGAIVAEQASQAFYTDNVIAFPVTKN